MNFRLSLVAYFNTSKLCQLVYLIVNLAIDGNICIWSDRKNVYLPFEDCQFLWTNPRKILKKSKHKCKRPVDNYTDEILCALKNRPNIFEQKRLGPFSMHKNIYAPSGVGSCTASHFTVLVGLIKLNKVTSAFARFSLCREEKAFWNLIAVISFIWVTCKQFRSQKRCGVCCKMDFKNTSHVVT